MTNETTSRPKWAADKTPHDLSMEIADFAIVGDMLQRSLTGAKSMGCDEHTFPKFSRICHKMGCLLLTENDATALGYELIEAAKTQWVGMYTPQSSALTGGEPTGKEPQALFILQCHFQRAPENKTRTHGKIACSVSPSALRAGEATGSVTPC